MRTGRLLALFVVLVVATVAASAGPAGALTRPGKRFCQAAYDYDNLLAKKPGIATQIKLVKKIAQYAPEDIKRDAATFLDALQRRAKGDRSVVDNPRIERAVKNVNRRAADGCNLYKQDPTSGI
jgi:hypothetical protein